MTFDEASAKWPSEVREYARTTFSDAGIKENDPLRVAIVAQIHVTEYLERRRRRLHLGLVFIFVVVIAVASYTFGRAQQFQIFYGQFYSKTTEVKTSIIDGKPAYVLIPK